MRSTSPIARSFLRSTDAQAQPRSLAAVAGQHLAGRQHLGVGERLFCFAKLIAVWRYAFQSWRWGGCDAIG